jgi:hypothetical protein
MIDALTQEVWNYYHERDEFPPGDGIGTASLVKALQTPSRSGFSYMTFVDEMLRRPATCAIRSIRRRGSCSTGTTGRGGVPTRMFTTRRTSTSGGGLGWGRDRVNNWNSVVSAP